MNTIEEISYPQNIPNHKVQDIEQRIRNVSSSFQSIKKDAKYLSDNIQEAVSPKQLYIIEQIQKKTQSDLLREKELFDTIEIDREFQEDINNIEQGRAKIVTYSMIGEKRQHLQKLKADTINLLKSIDFAQFRDLPMPKEENDSKFLSFNKIWIWILEVFYNTPLSKYYWLEFRNLVIRKDQGEELRRRMILFNVKNMGSTLQNELFEICEIHSNVVLDSFKSEYPEISKVIDVMKMFLKQKEEDILYNDIKKNAVGDDEVDKTKQQRLNDLKAKKGLSSMKVQILTEMNNIFNLINSNFS